MKTHTRSVVGLAGFIGAAEEAKAAGQDLSAVAAAMMVAKAATGKPTVKQADPSKRILQILLSDGSVDRDRDSIDPRGWDTRNFEANPVVLWAHSYSTPPIGRDTGLEKQQMFLAGHPQFHEETELARVCYNLLVGGYLNTASVGFVPMEWTWDEERRGYNILKQELVEYSIVPVPSNPNALVQARSAGIDITPIKGWAEEALDGLGFQVVERTQLEAAYLIAAGKKTISIPKLFVAGNDAVIVDADRIEIAGPDGAAVKTFVVDAAQKAPEAPAQAAEPKGAAEQAPSPETSAIQKSLDQIGTLLEGLGRRVADLETRGVVPQEPDAEELTQEDIKSVAAMLKEFAAQSISEIDTVFARATGKVN